MAEMVVLDQSGELEAILAILASAGYPTAPIPDLSPADKLTGGLAWCVAASEADSLPLHVEDFSIRDKIKADEVIEAALRSMECPYILHAHQIRELDYKSIYPAVKWIVGRVLAMQGNLEHKIEEESSNVQQLEMEVVHAENSINTFQASLKEQELKWVEVHGEIEHLNEKIISKNAKDVVNNLVSLLQSLKYLERKEADFHAYCNQKSSDSQTEALELEKKLSESNKTETSSLDLDHSLCDSIEMLNSTKRYLERKEADFHAYCNQKSSDSQTEALELEKKLSESNKTETSSLDLDHSLCDSIEMLNSTKRYLERKEADFHAYCNQKSSDSQTEALELEKKLSESNKTETSSLDLDHSLCDSIEMLNSTKRYLERKEADFHAYCNQKSSDSQTEALELEKKLSESNKTETSSLDLDHSLCDSIEMLNSTKRALAAKLRENLGLKRRLDDVPSQLELMQYERRFSELYVQIQETHRQTREYYATYNALMEVKELMLKETSLLNSISAQFQDAMTSTIGRTKLLDSLESIGKGIQQKLEKVHLGLEAEEKICDVLKEKYAAAIADQRHRSTLLKAFQEECARNERLRSLTSL